MYIIKKYNVSNWDTKEKQKEIHIYCKLIRILRCELISILEGKIKWSDVCTQTSNLHECASYTCRLIQECWMVTHILVAELPLTA